MDSNKSGTIVFLHYFGGSKESWNWTISHLDNDYNCVALNLPGFGSSVLNDEPSINSMSRFVTEKIKALNMGTCVLIGHSMGGKIAVQVAIDNSDTNLISQLILVAPSPPSVEKMPEKQRQVLRCLQDETKAIANVAEAVIKPLSSSQKEKAVTTQLEIQLAAREWWIDKGTVQSIADKSKSLRVAITVIASRTDPAISYEMTLKETMPNLPDSAKLITTTDIGHLIPLEDPVWLAKIIRDITKEAG